MDLRSASQLVPGYDFEIESYSNLKMLMSHITGYIVVFIPQNSTVL